MSVVVCPPETMLVIVVKTLEVTGGTRLDGTAGGGGIGVLEPNGGVVGGPGGPGGPDSVRLEVLKSGLLVGVWPLVPATLEGCEGAGQGREGCPMELEEIAGGGENAGVDDGGSGTPLLGGWLVITLVTNVVPERKVIVKVVVGAEGPGTAVGIPGVGVRVVILIEAPGEGVAGSDEMMGVISGVFVTRVLNLLGGATPPIHSVVPLITEKK